MKKILLLLPVLFCLACKDRGRLKPVAKDSVQKSVTDSARYNPATPAAQNSDDPSRFSQ